MATAIKKNLVDFEGHLIAEDTAKAITWLRNTLAGGPMLKEQVLALNSVRPESKQFSVYAIDKAASYLDIMRTREANTFQPKVIWELPKTVIDHGKRFGDAGTSPAIGKVMEPDELDILLMSTKDAMKAFIDKQGITPDDLFAKTKKPNGDLFTKSTITGIFEGRFSPSKFLIVCIANSFDVKVEDVVGSFGNFMELTTGQFRGGNRSSIGVINDYLRVNNIDLSVGDEELADIDKNRDRTPKEAAESLSRWELDPVLNVSLHIKLENGVMTLSYANGVSISVTSFDGDVSV